MHPLPPQRASGRLGVASTGCQGKKTEVDPLVGPVAGTEGGGRQTMTAYPRLVHRQGVWERTPRLALPNTPRASRPAEREREVGREARGRPPDENPHDLRDLMKARGMQSQRVARAIVRGTFPLPNNGSCL